MPIERRETTDRLAGGEPVGNRRVAQAGESMAGGGWMTL
jgi:hypothetical protein